MDNLIVSAPSNMRIMVYADGNETFDVDSAFEDEKVKAITDNYTETALNMTARTGYDAYTFLKPKYKNDFKVKVRTGEEASKFDVFKNSTIHIVGTMKTGQLAGQRVVEQYFKTNDENYPSPSHGVLNITVFSDYPSERVDWYVSVIGNNFTEFFLRND